MATNSNNSGGGNINYSPNVERNMGVTGNLQNRMAASEYQQRFYRQGSGYLAVSSDEIKAILKSYEEIASYTKEISKVEQNRFKKQQEALKQQLSTLKYVEENKNIDFEESKKLVEDTNRLLINGQKTYMSIRKSIEDNIEDSDKKHLKSLEDAQAYMNKIKNLTSETNEDLNRTSKILKNTSDDFGKSLANTLKGAADFTRDMANMLNLQSLANPEQASRDKLAARNAIMKQFGMTSDSQYAQFNKSLVNQLQDMNSHMGDLFSADDMYAYFDKMGELGITNSKIAEEQMKATILGTKYLGVSDETQQAIFKFMKRTNNYDLTANHNKTIVGLLKSQLGVNKEQLDALASIAYEGTDSKLALGMSSAAVTAQTEAMEIMGASISSLYGPDAAKAIEKSFNDFITNPGDAGWISLLGGNYSPIYNQATTATTVEAQRAAMYQWLNAMSGSNIIQGHGSGGVTGMIAGQQYNALGGLDDTTISTLKKFVGTDYLETEAKAVSGILNTTQNDVEEMVKNTTELTWLEKLSNDTSLMLEEVMGYRGTMKLANAAFLMYMGSGIVSLIANFKSINLTNLLTKQLGSGSSMGKHMADTAGLNAGVGAGGKALTGLATGAAVVGLTVAALNGIANAFDSAYDERYANNSKYIQDELRRN